jgi:CHAT domain-containing protein
MTPMPKDSIRMALVAEKRAQEARLHVIHQVEAEIDNIVTVSQAALVQITDRLSGSTTVLRTCNAMEVANVVHLACHGIQDADDATCSGFCLGDGRLTIGRLMDVKLDNAFLAYLSACETAQGDMDQPDQVMHLAAAMLFAGFKSVIATMWYVVLVGSKPRC